ncbi:MAG: hypothetical protein EB084_09710 [Proteobacteria bacterium]|nr:hypothetical protein [Pseudomonadota bacterium]
MTRSPQINAVLEGARARAAGRTAPELKTALEQAEQMLTQVQRVFEGQVRFRERTDVLKIQKPRVESALTRMREALASIRAERFDSGADALQMWFNTFTEAMDALKAEETGQPTYSRSPYLNILMRLAVGASRRTIAPEALQQGLSELLIHHRRVTAELDKVVRPGSEAAQYGQRRDEIMQHAQIIDRSLVEAQRQLSASALAAIPQTLRAACAAADALTAIQDDFKSAEEAARHRPCFRCGADNPRTVRHCVKCQAMLPPMPVSDDDLAAVDVTLEEGQARTRGHARTELSVKLEDAAHAVREGRIDASAFARVLDEAQDRLDKARQGFAALQVPPNSSDEEREAAAQAGEAMQTAFAQFDEGLQRMRAYLHDGNTATLEHGLEAALTGGDTLAAFSELAKPQR